MTSASTSSPSTRLVAAVIAVGGIALLTRVVLGRLFFAWPLEWMEGATVLHARRLLDGAALYAPPSADFVPNLYPPLAYVPVAASVAALGPSLWVARLPSVLCLGATLWLIALCALRATGARPAAALAAGLWALGYGYCGAFMDLARVDALFILLVCAGVERTLAGRVMQGLAWLALSCWAKQHGLIFLAFASAHALWAVPALRLRIAGLWALLLSTFAAGQLLTDGWLGYYTFAVPGAHGAIPHLMLSFLLVDVALYLPLLCAAALAGLWHSRHAPRALDALLVAGLCAGALGRGHVGGFDNVRLPAYALLCVAGVVQLWPWLSGPRARLALVATVVQAAVLVQAPSLHLPRTADASAFVALRQAVRDCGGEHAGAVVLAPDHAGAVGQGGLHTMALSDLRLAGGPRAHAGTEALVARLGAPDRPAVVVVGERFDELTRALAAHYRLCARPPRVDFVTGYDPLRAAVYSAREATPPP